MNRKINRSNKILSFLLAVVLFFCVLPLSAFSIDGSGDASVNSPYISLNGEQIDFLELHPHEKIDIQAEGTADAATYQWQILHPKQDGLWVNIYNANEQSIPVTVALVGNMLNTENAAQLRCRIQTDGEQWNSAPVTVQLLEADAGIPAMLSANPATTVADPAGANVTPLAEGDDGSSESNGTQTPEYVVVEVEYVRYDYLLNSSNQLVLTENGTAFTSYIATLHYGSPLEDTTVTFPTMIGYDTYLVKADGTDEKRASLTFDLDAVTKDTTYTVKYLPAEVYYTIRYYKQNVYDDLYVEETDSAVRLKGQTGTAPDSDAISKKFEGFESLYYQPDFIAADGSTVFEVYYERNYYLMEFDCNGGYGADTIYVRYGTYISIPNPVKAGWVFAGWDLVHSGESSVSVEDGVADPLPAEMPPRNSAYKALWTQADTTYSVAYWTVNDDGTRSYLGGYIEDGKSAELVDGEHNLGTGTTSTGYVCGTRQHAHTDSCNTCGYNQHQHTTACFTNLIRNDPRDDDRSVIAAVNHGKTNPEAGYLYVIQTSTGTLWPKYYLADSNGTLDYRAPKGVGDETTPATQEQVAVLIDGPVLGTGTYNGLTATKYMPKTICGQPQHIHDDTCKPCEEHTHGPDCKFDATYLDPVTSVTITKADGTQVTYTTDQQVLIAGDGSSVVNVYYQYREYTLRFYYAATTGGSDTNNDGVDDTFASIKVVGGSTWNFGTNSVPGPADGPQLANVGGWGDVDELPTLNAEGQKRGYTKDSLTYNGTTYHYISFKARYGDNIVDLWPCGVFNSVTRVYANTHGNWSGKEAFVSAWNGEHRVKYSQDHENETIKGTYEMLDENLLFDSNFADSTEVSYLCFWENGADIGWSVPELYRYNIYLETYPGQDLTNVTTTIRDGKTYYLYRSYDTCDDSDIKSQTQPALTGYDPITFEDHPEDGYSYEPSNDPYIDGSFEYKKLSNTEFDTTLYKEGYELNFYYTRKSHKLFFWNHDAYLTDGTGADVVYGDPLKKRFEGVTVDGVKYEGANDLVLKPEKYPKTLEPNSYVFQGWYTTPEFHADTLVDAAALEKLAMPDGDMKIYAKWSPVVHDVYFYYLYDDIADDNYWDGALKPDGTYPIKVEHGSLLGTTYALTPTRENYTFIGWFYMDEDNKKRFAPDTMEVTSELHLFAEWQSGIDTTYEVSYVLKEAYGDYPAGYEIAAKSAGHITAGKTKTFSAKGWTDLAPDFRTGFFPTVNSHSILMDAVGANNVHRFEYVHDDKVLYKVRYVNASTGVVMEESAVKETNHAIVTEKFKPFVGFIPQSYYARKTLAYDGQATAPIDANIITFYYTPDTLHGLYSIEYYLENEDSTDSTKPENYSQTENVVGSGNINEKLTATVRKYTGYTHVPSMNTVISYNSDGTEKEVKIGVGKDDTPAAPYGTIEYTGLTIRIYYQRNSYPYKITYINAKDGVALTPQDATLAEKLVKQDGKFGKEFTHTAVLSFKATDGNTYEYYIADATAAERTQTRTIAASVNVADNTMTFYYTQKKVTVLYHAVCTVPGIANFGAVSPNGEVGTKVGSTALPYDGFRFLGWYKDEACTNAVDASWVKGAKLEPGTLNEDEDWTNHYYALFEPVQEDLKITNTAADTTDTFLFQVTGTDVLGNDVNLTVSIQGSGNVVIKNLYCGDYTVTELTGWSWTHQCTGNASRQVTLTTKDTISEYSVDFTNTAQSPDWLHGESTASENQFHTDIQ